MALARIGIYGGTFNPPHCGHIHAACQAAQKLCLDKVLLIPDNIAPHKQLPEDSASAQQRLEMLCIAAAGIERLEVSDIELRRQGTSYTYETVMALRQQYPDAELTLLMGTDMFLSFGSWKNPQIITREARLGVLYRGERDEILAIRQQAQRMQEKGVSVVLVDNPVLAISSTDLRRMLVFGCADPELPEGVAEYIRQKGLYGTSKNRKGLTQEQLEAYFAEHEEDYAASGVTRDSKFVDVRHILAKVADTATEEDWKACEEKAQAILDAWLAGDKTEESFAALAAEKTEDPGSQATGGLYQQVYEGQMVPEFNDWCFDASRAYGDYGLVKTTYGYHIMFFVGSQDIWYVTVESDMINDVVSAIMPAAMEKHPMTVDYSAIKLSVVEFTSG